MATLKFVLSWTCTKPPRVCRATGPLAREKTNGFGGAPAALLIASWSAASGAGNRALIDPEVMAEHLAERLGRQAEVQGQHVPGACGSSSR